MTRMSCVIPAHNQPIGSHSTRPTARVRIFARKGKGVGGKGVKVGGKEVQEKGREGKGKARQGKGREGKTRET